MERFNKILILDNLRSVYNVGAIFRTADAVGIERVILVGETPTPIDKYGRPRKDFAKTALGAEQTIPWFYSKKILPVIKQLKQDGFQIVALEQDTQSVDYKKIKLKKKAAIILGNEPQGIKKDVLAACDLVAEIAMKGKKESLNVSVATGIFLFRVFKV